MASGALDDAVTGALEAGLGKSPRNTTLFEARCWAKTARSTHSRGSWRAFFFKSVDDVKSSIKRCWCSALQPRVFAYRSRAGLKPEDIRVAVVVQRMINSRSPVSSSPFTPRPAIEADFSQWPRILGEVSSQVLATPTSLSGMNQRRARAYCRR